MATEHPPPDPADQRPAQLPCRVRFITAQGSRYSGQRSVRAACQGKLPLGDKPQVHEGWCVALAGGPEGYWQEGEGFGVEFYALVQMDDGALVQVNASSCWLAMHGAGDLSYEPPRFAPHVPEPGPLATDSWRPGC